MAKTSSRSARPARRDRQDENATIRANLHDEVTFRIIAQLEAGRVPWVQPWGTVGAANARLPCNALTGRRYSEINVLILWGAVIEGAYPDQGWLTLEAGGCVRKGEKGATVFYADSFVPDAEKARAPSMVMMRRPFPFSSASRFSTSRNAMGCGRACMLTWHRFLSARSSRSPRR